MKVMWLVGWVAACGSDGPSYEPPPAEAVASCKLVEKASGTVLHQALWFDSAGNTIQSDGYDGSYTYAYDGQNRLVGAKTPQGTITWTYEPTRITELHPKYMTVYELGSDGRVSRVDDGDSDTFPTDVVDFTYDAAGHITSEIATPYPDPGYPMSTDEHRFAYDAQGRVISAFRSSVSVTMAPTTYTYTEMLGSLTVQLAGNISNRVYSYELDAEGRIVHAGVDQTDVPASSGFSYSYVDDTLTATSDDHRFEVTATGACPPLTTAFAPPDPLPIRMSNLNVAVPNPPVDDFNAGVY